MVSLQSSCTVLSTNSISPFSCKPSLYLLPNARRSHRYHISCNGGAEQKEGKLDRRNMLLGIGGLYGAANLLSDQRARADPIQPPDLTTCSSIIDVNGIVDALDAHCCPPLSDTIIDYTLPTVTSMRVRPAAHALNKRNRVKYEEAIRRMKALDITDPSDPRGFMQQANVHCAYCNNAYDQIGHTGTPLSIHYSWLFFPFHRWYLYFYERILGSLIDDPTFALPFWNWDSPRGMKLPRMFFDNQYSPLYDANRNPEHLRTVVDLTMSDEDGTDDLQKITNNLSVMYNEMIRSVDETLDFMGQRYKAGEPAPASAKGGTSERGSHTAIHKWVGHPKNTYNEDLGNFYSAGRDAAFYCHHANVDRMWTIWRSDLIKTDVAKDIKDSDYLNAAFLFYDEKKQLVRVKASDCIDYKKMGYEYEKVDIPWLNYRPPRRAGGVPIKDISKGAQHPDKVFPLTLNKITRVLVSKTKIGKVNEVLVLEDIETNPRKMIKFDVYVNDEDDYPRNVDKAEYAGTFAQLPHKGHHDHTNNKNKSIGSIRMSLKELYEDIDIDDDDTIVVTIVPRISGPDVTIGGIKIIESSSPKASAA